MNHIRSCTHPARKSILYVSLCTNVLSIYLDPLYEVQEELLLSPQCPESID